MNIKKTHSQNGKKYNVIINAEENIVEDKQYPAIFKEVKMSNKAPAWFQSFQKEMLEFKNNQEQFNQNQEQFNKEVISRLDQVDSRLDRVESRLDNLEKDVHAIKNCPTIKAELQQTN